MSNHGPGITEITDFTPAGDLGTLDDQSFITNEVADLDKGGSGFNLDFFKNNPAMGTSAVGGAAEGLGGLFQYFTSKRKAKRDRQKKETAFRAEVENLRNVDVSNPFARISNPYANLTVNQQQARFQAEQGQQALTDILAQQSAAAGGSGIAALAQAMANQRTSQIQQSSASIGQQESANTRLQAQGEAARQMAIARGEQTAQDQRATKASVLTDIAGKEYQSAVEYEQQLDKALGSGLGGAATLAAQLAVASDRSLKTDIKFLRYSPSGLKIYSFKYKDTKFGKGFFEGVMSDEVPSYAVIRNNNYDMVDYNKIDVDFKSI